MKQTELQKGYSRIPQGFHDALASAVSQIKEDAPVKKRHVGLLVAVLIAALLCGTALAIINYYSVRDYQAQGSPSEGFEQLVEPIGQTYENDYITLTVGDTIFDGQSIALTMNIYSKDERKPVFLYPALAGYCGERKLDIDVEGMRGLDQSGFLYPNVIDGDRLDHQYGMDAVLFEDAADGDITWTFTMRVLVPNWPIRSQEIMLSGDESDPPMEEYMRRFRDAYANRQILATYGESLVEYAASLPAPDGMTDEEWGQLRLPDRLVASGAFTPADTFACTFVTKLPEVTRLSGQTFALDGYTVEVDALSISALRVDFSLRHRYPAESMAPNDIHYELRDQEGKPFAGMWNGCERSDDGVRLACYGAAMPARDELSAITFVPYTFEQNAKGGYEARYAEEVAFTVTVAP